MAVRDDRNGSRSAATLSPTTEPRQNDGSSLEAAGFVADSIGELIKIAQRHGLDTLCYLLDMARLEAEEARRRPRR